MSQDKEHQEDNQQPNRQNQNTNQQPNEAEQIPNVQTRIQNVQTNVVPFFKFYYHQTQKEEQNINDRLQHLQYNLLNQQLQATQDYLRSHQHAFRGPTHMFEQDMVLEDNNNPNQLQSLIDQLLIANQPFSYLNQLNDQQVQQLRANQDNFNFNYPFQYPPFNVPSIIPLENPSPEAIPVPDLYQVNQVPFFMSHLNWLYPVIQSGYFSQYMQQPGELPRQQRRRIPPNNNLNNANNNNQIANSLHKYYQKKEKPLTVPEDFCHSEPHLKVSYVKQNEHNQEEAYYINKSGLWKSQKNTIIEDIMIGRQLNYQYGDDIITPNDIVLPFTDRAISRVHCKLLVNEGFKRQESIQSDYFEFLKVCHPSSSKTWSRLPLNVLQIIESFSRTLGQFFVQDLGSVQGTYIKVRNNVEQVIQKGNTYFIGADTVFYVINCTSQFHVENHYEETLLDYIRQKPDGEKLHGLSPKEYQKAVIKKQERILPIDLESTPLSKPFLKIQFTNMNPIEPQIHTFFAQSPQEDTNYRFGRNQDNDVVINFNTISRKQCRLRYIVAKQQWTIADGEPNRESSNGTWMSLTNQQDKKDNQREESKKTPIVHNTEIKISESVLKVEMVNFHKKTKQRKLKKNLYISKWLSKREEKRKEFLKKLFLLCEDVVQDE